MMTSTGSSFGIWLIRDDHSVIKSKAATGSGVMVGNVIILGKDKMGNASALRPISSNVNERNLIIIIMFYYAM